MKRVGGGREEHAARGRTAELDHYATPLKAPAASRFKNVDIKVAYGSK